jgi:small subunit ribosomal protein S16
MLTIRLTRVGKKKDASFRVVVVESKRKVQAGNYLEMVGSYDPRVDTVALKADRIKHWLSMGATVSDTVHNLLVSNKIIDAKKKNVLPKKVLAKPEAPASADSSRGGPAAEASAAAAEAAPAEAEPAGDQVAETTEEKAAGTETDAPTEDNPVVQEESAQ